MAEELNFVEEIAGDHVKVVLSGEVDIYTSQELKENLYRVVESNKKDVIIDCKELNYIDSTGLGIFVGALKKAKQYEKKIKIINLKDNIKKLFIITGLDKIFEVE
ncbi:STAS domain-containing protein [Acetivibrio saccincola]|jgi:anti-sigma B factor antagonist|uniref:Anti-sigma factor antagonist n=1 Tax=Acetivibrio saccincola TaxID=1677857 RepID=A0A2K9E8S7_9FIRM|nr:STAS domain-containing protein [Acetivibrio saccincola]AUG58928.1 Anti-sigma-B factor antagonist [Acetivibrio saccincola]NLW26946.1 STAS domain-containing protein [Acetivibrio saccincola]PQQ65991.1 anti-anti-sigma factor [Acetivibrio saccincola]HOA98173.1 STAS domain-containing protein [Acetivibrio saccincola]HQD29896.1 STAS domain-containing protein [Acetivibrio saccincola]